MCAKIVLKAIIGLVQPKKNSSKKDLSSDCLFFGQVTTNMKKFLFQNPAETKFWLRWKL